MEFTLMSGIGDQLAATAVIRAVKQRLPNENLRIYEPFHPEIWSHNPYLRRGIAENGVRLHLDSPPGGQRIAQHYMDKIRNKLKLEDFDLGDDTPDLFLTDAEKAQTFPVARERSVAINDEAGWSTRRWPYYADLATMLLKHGWSVYHVGADASRALPCTASFHNKLTVRQSAVLLSQMSRVVCNDTGLFHLAAAVGTPCVGLFGFIPASERVYETTRAPHGNEACLKGCNYTQCRKSFTRCHKLDHIPVRDVFAEVVR